MESTAMGIEAETVSPARRPTYTVTAPKNRPARMPSKDRAQGEFRQDRFRRHIRAKFARRRGGTPGFFSHSAPPLAPLGIRLRIPHASCGSRHYGAKARRRIAAWAAEFANRASAAAIAKSCDVTRVNTESGLLTRTVRASIFCASVVRDFPAGCGGRPGVSVIQGLAPERKPAC